jgi:hypothetical protein
MDKLGVQTAILSPPPISFTPHDGAEDRAKVRQQNIYSSQLRATYPSRFGFLAGLPFLDDVKGTFSCKDSFRVVSPFLCEIFTGSLEEIAFSFDVLGADGVALLSSYGDGNSASTAF